MNWKGVLKQKLWIGGDGLPNNLSIGTPSLFLGEVATESGRPHLLDGLAWRVNASACSAGRCRIRCLTAWKRMRVFLSTVPLPTRTVNSHLDFSKFFSLCGVFPFWIIFGNNNSTTTDDNNVKLVLKSSLCAAFTIIRI